MSSLRGHFISMDSQLGSQKNPGPLEFSMPRINKMTPAMLLIMISVAMVGMYVGYQISHHFLVSLVIGGVFGRIGMWVGMISCVLVEGIENFLQNIFR